MFLGIVVTKNNHGAFTPAFVLRGRNNERIASQLITQFTKVLVFVLHDLKERHVLEGRKARRKEGRKEGRKERRSSGMMPKQEIAPGVGGGLRSNIHAHDCSHDTSHLLACLLRNLCSTVGK
jgi:hypothetical protein